VTMTTADPYEAPYDPEVAAAARQAAGVPLPAGSTDRDRTSLGHTEPGAPVVVTVSTVAVERVRWLWPRYLPAGKMVVIDGDPSTGKSTLMMDLAARCSTGSPWPDGTPGRAVRDVVLMSAEDGIADTIAPRLHAAGADTERVHVLTGVTAPGTPKPLPPTLPRDLDMLERVIGDTGAALVVIDVLMAYLDGHTDSHRDQDVRAVLARVADLAERTGACIVLLRHMNKSGGGNALYRGGGSIGIIGAARAGYLVARDPDDADRRVLAVTKINIAAEPPTLAYRLVSDDDLGCARVQWEDEPVAGVTAASLLRAPLDDDERSERDSAVEWLEDHLTGGGKPSAEVKRAARAAGFSDRTLARARARLGVVVEDVKTGSGRGTTWALGGRATPPGTTPRGTTPNRPSDLRKRGKPKGGRATSESWHDPLCRVCSEPLDPILAPDGVHPLCGETGTAA